MRGLRPWLILSLGLALLFSTAVVAARAVVPEPASPSWPEECVPDELLVKFRPGADPAAVAARHGASIKEPLVGIEVFVVSIPAGTVAEKIAELEADPDVVYAEPNGIVRVPESPPAKPGSCGG